MCNPALFVLFRLPLLSINAMQSMELSLIVSCDLTIVDAVDSHRFSFLSELLFALLPEFILVFGIHLVAHDPDWENPRDPARLEIVKE